MHLLLGFIHASVVMDVDSNNNIMSSCTTMLIYCRPPIVSHDHCYTSATQEGTAGVVAMETGSATPTGVGGEERSKSVVEGDEVKDNRKCLLCPVEGDAGCMVR
jgi:hypothetical protein